MYNGIGLPTARGSGTNGYVQKNMAHVSKKIISQPNQPDPNINKKPNKDIMLHQKKREIESKCLRLRKELEEEGSPNIEEEIDAYRKRKLAELAADQ